jgi:methyl-accepting chemotaxis protein
MTDFTQNGEPLICANGQDKWRFLNLLEWTMGVHLAVGMIWLADLVFIQTKGVQLSLMAIVAGGVVLTSLGIGLFASKYTASIWKTRPTENSLSEGALLTEKQEKLVLYYPWFVSTLSAIGWAAISLGAYQICKTGTGGADCARVCIFASIGMLVAGGMAQYYLANWLLFPLRRSVQEPAWGKHLLVMVVSVLVVVFTALLITNTAGLRTGITHFVLLALTMLLVAWLASKMVSTPWELLSKEIQLISSGDFSRELQISPHSKAGVCVSLQSMTAAMRKLLQDCSRSSKELKERIDGMSQIGEYLDRSLRSRKHQALEALREVKREKQATQEVTRVIGEMSSQIDEASAGQAKLESVLDEGRKRELDLENTIVASRRELQALVQAVGVSHTKISTLADAARQARANLVESGKTLQSLDESAREGIQVAQRLFQETCSGERAVEKCIDGAEALRRLINQAKARTESLQERSSQISSVVDFVNDVASRTNLLSLNASIIAAQAGEHGKSFGVVSDLIRELAVQVGKSALSISGMVAEVRTDIEGASILIRQSHDLVSEELENAKDSGESLRRIAGEVAYCREIASLAHPVILAYCENARQTEQFANHAVDVAESFVGTELFARGSRAIDSLAQTLMPLLQTFGRSYEEQALASRAQMVCLEEIHRVMALLGQMVSQKERGAAQVLERLSQFHDLCEEDGRQAQRLSQDIHWAVRNLQSLSENLSRHHRSNQEPPVHFLKGA